MSAQASASTVAEEEDFDEDCGPQLISKLEVLNKEKCYESNISIRIFLTGKWYNRWGC